jgi:hypothetical protein
LQPAINVLKNKMMISSRGLFLLLLLSELIILAMYFFPANWSWAIEDRFDLDKEANVPTWFAVTLLFSISIIALLIHIVGRSIRIATSWRSFWIVFSAVFCFLSLDEASRVHEGIDNVFHIKWIYVYMPFASLFFIVCTYFLIVINKDKTLTYWISGGLLVYALGGLLCETISFYLYSGKAEVVFEEGLEILGTIMILTGCVQELNRQHKVVYIQKGNI